MKLKLLRILGIVFTAMLFAGIDPRPVLATNCGPLDATLIPIIYEAATGKKACVSTVVGTGPPLQPRIMCTPARLASLPDFKQRGAGAATYRFAGNCTSPDRPGAQMTYEIGGQWTPSESKGHNASEVIQIIGYEPFVPDRSPGGQIFIMKYARCTRDPWLNPVACTNYGVTVPDDIRGAWSQVDEFQFFPWTANVISPADKRQLISQYNQINRVVPRLSTTLQPGVRASTAPTIIQPGPNGLVTYDSKFQIVPAQSFTGSQILVHFTQRDVPPGQLAPTFPWVRPTRELSQGSSVPREIFSDKRKRLWSMSARIESPKTSDLSAEVPFTFTPTQSTETKPRSSPYLRR